jgi:hypothetical protein
MADNGFFLPACCICRRQRELPADHYFLYVIKLDPKAMPGVVSACGLVYVGQSWHTPECRFEQHSVGYKSNREAREYGVELCPSLYAGLNPIIGRTAAEQAEIVLAARLREVGFAVISN